jgi:hypothetical protein
MSIGSYPRVTVQGTGKANNTQNGLGLMLFNSTTQQYEAATAATFAGGGGGGDATAANQATQITEAQTTNSYLFDGTSGSTAAELLQQSTSQLASININVATAANQTTTNNELTNILAMLTAINGGETGSKLYTTDLGLVTGLSIRKIVVNEDAVLSNLRDANGNNLITLYNLSSKTLKQGSVLVVYDGSSIEQVQVTSGSVFAYGI